MRISFLIRSFAVGGAERQLALLADSLAARGHDVTVVVLSKEIDLADRIDTRRVRLVCIDKRSRWDFSGWAVALAKEFRRARPAVLCGWLPAESLIGYAISRLVAPLPYIWAVRASNVNFSDYDGVTGVVYRFHRWLVRAGAGAAVVFNSHAGAAFFNMTEDGRRCNVVWNGLDPQTFFPDTLTRGQLRDSLQLAADVPVIGVFGRLIPAKDHRTFLRAARLVRESRPDARFLVIGGGSDAAMVELRRAVDELNLGNSVSLLGTRRDVAQLMNTCDVVVSTSMGSEGVQNTLVEAMACGRPVVATRVGDVARFVSSLDRVVPPRDAAAVATGILELLGTDTAELRERRWQHAQAMFGVQRMCERFEQVVEFAWQQGTAHKAVEPNDSSNRS